MEGTVLGIDPETRVAAIKAKTGERLYFAPEEWKGTFPVTAGIAVDFDVESSGQAKNVYPVGRMPGQASTDRPPKSKTATTLFAFFLGAFGAHKFYLGAWGWGLLYLLFCWTYIPLLLAIIETVRYIVLKDDEFNERYAKLSGGPFDFLW